MSSRAIGNKFEDDFENSCKKLDIFFNRNRDVYIPPDLRSRIKIPKNLYDYFIFSEKTLFPLELKTTDDTKFSLNNIADHQIDSLTKASKFDDVIAGVLINFRHEDRNKCYFIHIKDFNRYIKVASGELENTYLGKVNRKSIPWETCAEIGMEVGNYKLKVNYHYHAKDFVKKALKEYVEKK